MMLDDLKYMIHHRLSSYHKPIHRDLRIAYEQC